MERRSLGEETGGLREVSKPKGKWKAGRGRLGRRKIHQAPRKLGSASGPRVKKGKR